MSQSSASKCSTSKITDDNKNSAMIDVSQINEILKIINLRNTVKYKVRLHSGQILVIPEESISGSKDDLNKLIEKVV